MRILVAIDPAYSFDKIEIHTYLDIQELKALLPIEKIEKECRQIILLPAGKKAKLCRYKSKIILTVPTEGCFAILAWLVLGKYKITYIEIAKDVFYETETEATFASYRILEKLRKKYTAKTEILDYRDSYNSTKSAYEKGLFSQETIYLGSYIFNFVLYARISKINSLPCVHSEWRFRGSRNIKDKLGIESFEDCHLLDLNNEYEKFTAKYIVIEEIDMEKLGKWFLGWGKKKNFTKRQNIRIGIAAFTMLNVAKLKDNEDKEIIDIRTPAQLAEWFKQQKNRIESPRGPRTDWDKKIMKVQSNSKFSRHVEL